MKTKRRGQKQLSRGKAARAPKGRCHKVKESIFFGSTLTDHETLDKLRQTERRLAQKYNDSIDKKVKFTPNPNYKAPLNEPKKPQSKHFNKFVFSKTAMLDLGSE
jgi:hypothetical protein